MKRREFLGASAAALGSVLGASQARAGQPKSDNGKDGEMKAGFTRVSITPPVGTKMMGFGGRDMERGCAGVHDDIHIAALYLEQDGEKALIMACDLCFLGREEADRFKGAIGRMADILPRQILMNASHNHVGPSVGTWYSAGYEIPDRLYLNDLEAATVRAAKEAMESARPATIQAGVGRTKLPMNRRRRMPDGAIENRPNPDGYVYDRLPVCLAEDADGKPICLMFSVSTHPSMMSGWDISAEYCGAAVRGIDKLIGAECAMFLQGCGGDSKPSVIGRGGVDRWQPGTWELMEEAGAMVAGEVAAVIKSSLKPVVPSLRTASVEMRWPLQEPSERRFYEEIAQAEKNGNSVRRMWAEQIIRRMDRGETLPKSFTLTAHGVRIGEGLRIVGIEGEAVGEWGKFIEEFYGGGVTFPLGYTDGQGLYLPTTRMLPEGGYEVVSSWEYGLASALAPGMEDEVARAMRRMGELGVK